MVKGNGDQLITAGRDPAAVESLLGGARRNKAALSRKQLYDSKRIRVRVDVPAVIQERLREVAGELGTSVTDLGAFLFAFGLALYYESAQDLLQLLEFEACSSPKKAFSVKLDAVLERLQESVAISADRPLAALDPASDGADGGADRWGDWLNA